MKKGVSYIIVLVLIAAVLFFLYSSGPRFTGFAVFEQITQTDFDEGIYTNTLYNGSAVVLNSSANATSGTYTSNFFDANSSVTWNNLTWLVNVPANTSFSWQVRSCTNSNCSDANFTTVSDLNNLNLTGQYFQYQASFSGYTSTDNVTNITTLISPTLASVTVSSSLIVAPVTTSVTINEPSGTKDVDSGIPIKFTITGGENLSLSCWYNLKYVPDNTIVITNTTLANCNTSSFDVPNEGDYILNLYVNSSKGLFYDDSSFSVNLTKGNKTIEEEITAESTTQVPVIPTIPAIELSAADISAISLASGDTHEITWSISNTGRNPVSACSVKSLGDYASWIVASADTLNINSGEEGVFAFSINVPADIVAGSYVLSVSVECAETAVSKDFSVEVSEIIETGKGAPVGGGFAIFGEGGLGTGGIIILVIVILALGVVLFFARRMRKSGKTLKDIFRFRRPQEQT